MPWYWNPRAGRYMWQNGRSRFISRDTIMGYVNELLAGSTNVVRSLGNMVGDGQLNPLDWRMAMRNEIKAEYIRQYVLGRGGRDQMTPADWGRIGGMVREQYGFLDQFTEQIQADAVSTGQIGARSEMYILSAREGFERARWATQIEAGMTEVRWRLMPGCDHCDGCLELSEMGWMPIQGDPFGGAFPGSGATPCLTRCCCELEYQ